MQALSRFLLLSGWHSTATGVWLGVFRAGKALGVFTRCAFAMGSIAAVIACVISTDLLFVIAFAAGPLLLLAVFGELIAHSLMRRSGASQR